jgi:hypothetical protein
MSVCGNCKAKLSCGCQRRKASDGTQVCSNCLTKYEGQLKKKVLNPNSQNPIK